MANRRQFLAGLLATGLAPRPSWADAGSPAFLSAAGLPDGTFQLCGIGADLNILFRISLAGRGHAAAAHPRRPEAVTFARRPGTFAMVIDCATGLQITELHLPEGRHFYGHGVFSDDGNWLFTTENHYHAGEGRIGVWDASNGYRRADDISSGGIGPHDIKRLPETDRLVVANGGIETHPDTGRTKLNIPTMHPNLSYIENGQVLETVDLPPHLRKNSIRHLAITPTGLVAFGMQWQGGGQVESLVGLHQPGGKPILTRAPDDALHPMRGYVGSIAATPDGQRIIVTSPRGGLVQFYDIDSATLTESVSITDASGVATTQGGTLISSGTGRLRNLAPDGTITERDHPIAWDNHLVTI